MVFIRRPIGGQCRHELLWRRMSLVATSQTGFVRDGNSVRFPWERTLPPSKLGRQVATFSPSRRCRTVGKEMGVSGDLAGPVTRSEKRDRPQAVAYRQHVMVEANA